MCGIHACVIRDIYGTFIRDTNHGGASVDVYFSVINWKFQCEMDMNSCMTMKIEIRKNRVSIG